MVAKPDEKPRWATVETESPISGINNVISPPESKKNVGWNTFEMPARQFFNWLHLKAYQWINFFDYRITDRFTTTDGDGVALFPIDDSLIVLYAVDITTPANYIHATGFRAASGAPVLNVLSNNVLTLGATDTDGTQAISGGTAANIIAYGQSQIIND
jgi:hypothetical protein